MIRNTIEIAQFAKPLLDGVPLDEDGAVPDFSKATRHGPLPVVVTGLYSSQVEYALRFIRTEVDLSVSSVVFLHPAGWFSYLKRRLLQEGLNYVEITRLKDWPSGSTNVGLSTMHSVKGLEFDHVLIFGTQC